MASFSSAQYPWQNSGFLPAVYQPKAHGNSQESNVYGSPLRATDNLIPGQTNYPHVSPQLGSQQLPQLHQPPQCLQAYQKRPIVSGVKLDIDLHVICFTKRWMPCAEFLLGEGCLNSSGPACKFLHVLPYEFEEQAKLIIGLEAQNKLSHLKFQACLKVFYSHNVFLFGSRYGGDAPLREKVKAALRGTRSPKHISKREWNLLRDPVATRLLEFIDEPGWKNKGSSSFRQPTWAVDFQKSDEYRHLIKSICIKLSNPYITEFVPDWDWPLKIDWKSLPRLEYLQLDLRTYSRHPWIQMGDYYTPEQYQVLLQRGAERMKCLNLKKLTLVGLCSYWNWGNKDHERKMDALFRPAVRYGGFITFVDTPIESIPLQPMKDDGMGLLASLPGVGQPSLDVTPEEVQDLNRFHNLDSPVKEKSPKFLTQEIEEMEEREPENSLLSVARRIPLNWNGKY